MNIENGISINKRFDVIYSSLTFIHISDKKTAIKKVSELLKPNGRFVLSMSKSQDKYLGMNSRKLEIFPAVSEEIKVMFNDTALTIDDYFETEFAFIIAGERRAL